MIGRQYEHDTHPKGELHMLRGLSRWAPFTGVVSAVLGVAGGAIEIITNAPGSDASGKEVIAFYAAHAGPQEAAAALLGLAFVFLIFFAGSLRAYLLQTPRLEALGAVVLAGAVLETAGQTLGAGSVWALAQDSAHLDPAAAQGLNVLGSDAVATNTAGLIVFGIAAGLAILSSGRLPSWLGWVAIDMAVVVVTPAEALSFIALAIWMVILSILMWRRSGESAEHHAGNVPSHGEIAGR
jgi:hypothetical protein